MGLVGLVFMKRMFHKYVFTLLNIFESLTIYVYLSSCKTVLDRLESEN